MHRSLIVVAIIFFNIRTMHISGDLLKMLQFGFIFFINVSYYTEQTLWVKNSVFQFKKKKKTIFSHSTPRVGMKKQKVIENI